MAPISPLSTSPLSTLFPGLTVADAYTPAIQRRNVTRCPAAGATLIGHKVGLTAAATRELLGVSEPDFGHLLDDTLHENGATLSAARYYAPRVEPEILFRLARPLRGPGVTISDVLAATEAVARPWR
ncbi:hypothetical protein ABT147_41760 [Streptomyces sp. NPDC001868]|uniref:2-keto-4-pentenoate hydratase n=1 Tax=Streptomyces sp. NPDC001868 TaxID=3154401 RepID=UPI0033218D89